jgi:hypothetical protein
MNVYESLYQPIKNSIKWTTARPGSTVFDDSRRKSNPQEKLPGTFKPEKKRCIDFIISI